MAANSGNPTNQVVDEDYISMSLHEMFHIVGDQMTERDIKLLKFFCVGLISEDMTSKVHDGFSFLLCMEKMNLVSESNFMNVLDLLRIINRHDLSQFVHLRCRKTVRPDPICEYLESTFTQSQSTTDKPLSTPVQYTDLDKTASFQLSMIEGHPSTVETAVHGDHPTTETSLSKLEPPTANVVHFSSGISSKPKILPQDSKPEYNTSCQSRLSSLPSSSFSSPTSVCSSPESLLSGEACVQQGISAVESTRSKRLRSGDHLTEIDDSNKRRRKNVERTGNSDIEVKDHDITDPVHVAPPSDRSMSPSVQVAPPSDRSMSPSVQVAPPSDRSMSPSVQERMATSSNDCNRTSKSLKNMMASPSKSVQGSMTSTCDKEGSDTESSCTKSLNEGKTDSNHPHSNNSGTGESGANTDGKKERLTCDIRLRVRAEVALQESALEGNVFSNKPTVVERQCEKFIQANTVLKSHDLGSIVCDIKFSDLTYLDAFWRDYINGSLLEALKGVFLTESLKQAVGHEAIKLLVNVDEDDYEAGRVKLLQNFKN